MLNSRKRWQVKQIDKHHVQHLQAELNISSLVSSILVSRGWEDVEDVRRFLYIEEGEFLDPFLLEGMQETVDRLRYAVSAGESIRIYGDYDCDGVTSTVILFLALQKMGAKVDYYIPNRFEEGYGLNRQALEKARDEGIHLLVSVDTGISGREEVAYGIELGLEIIVTDHHEPPPNLPECTAVVNPKKPGCPYPFKQLSGAGVALKIVQGLWGQVPYELMDIAAIGTIADLVPLYGENRLIAYHGLKILNQTGHVGVQALLDIAGLQDTFVDEQHVGFALGPRINASGRLRSAYTAAELLLAKDEEEAAVLAKELDALNVQRQTLVKQTSDEAVRWVEEHYAHMKPKALVVADAGWHEGILGIVASKLVERYHVPTLVLTMDPDSGLAKGSGRSIEGFDMFQALTACREWLSDFGGHPMAAGMSLPAENIANLRSRLAQLAEQWLSEADLKPLVHVDCSLQAEALDLSALEELSLLAPYGVEHPRPVVMMEGLLIEELKGVGASGQHLKCRLEQGGFTIEGIGFNLGKQIPRISPGAVLDVVAEPAINEWNGQKKPQLLIKDLRVKDRQFFDWRGVRDWGYKWQEVYFDQAPVICCFDQQNLEQIQKEIQLLGQNLPIAEFNAEGHLALHRERSLAADTYILYDLPYSLEQLDHALTYLHHGQRYYLLLRHEQDHFLSTIPEREHFRWFYGFLKQREAFDIHSYGTQLAKHKGWTWNAIQFMTEVFLELRFVTMEQGRIRVLDAPAKKNLTESSTYRRKLEQLEVEQALIYSSYGQLSERLRSVLQKVSHEDEEARIHGF